MTRHVLQIALVLLGATVIALGIAELRTARAAAPVLVADAGTAASAIPPPPESAHTPAPAIIEPGAGYAAYRHRQPTIAAAPPAPAPPSSPEPWERGEVVALGILAVYFLAGLLAKHDRKRAAIWTGVVTGLTGLVAAVAGGVTPTMPMILGAIVAGGGIAAQSPLRPRAAASERGSVRGTVIVWLACIALAFVACARYAKPTTTAVVDCTFVAISEPAAEIEAAIRARDWDRVRALVAKAGWRAGGCALATVVDQLLEAPAGARVAPRPDPSELRAGWEAVQREQLGGWRYEVAPGRVP